MRSLYWEGVYRSALQLVHRAGACQRRAGLPVGSEGPADIELDEVAAEIHQVERAVAAALMARDLDVPGDRDRQRLRGLPVDAGADEGGVAGMAAEAQRVLLAQMPDLAAEIDAIPDLPGERGAEGRGRAAPIGLRPVPDQVVREVDGTVERARNDDAVGQQLEGGVVARERAGRPVVVPLEAALESDGQPDAVVTMAEKPVFGLEAAAVAAVLQALPRDGRRRPRR